MIGWLAMGAVMAGTPMGFLGDGTSTYPNADPPVGWSEAQERFRAPLPSWGNASPILVGDQVCVTAEPTWLLCFDAVTGEERWRASNTWVDTLSGGEREEMLTLFAELDADEARLIHLRGEFSRLRREARRGASVDDDIRRVSRQIDEITERLESWRGRRTPPELSIMGYATPTPVTDGEAIFALFSNGVASRFEPDGRRIWSVWLGERPGSMRGYDHGTSASPRLAGGVVVVAHRVLSGLDPATGAVKWSGAMYRDYGTPSVIPGATVEQDRVVLPDGQVIRASNGERVGEGVGDTWFVGQNMGYTVAESADSSGRQTLYLLSGTPAASLGSGTLWTHRLRRTRLPAGGWFRIA